MKVTCFIVMDWSVRSRKGKDSEAGLKRVLSELSATQVISIYIVRCPEWVILFIPLLSIFAFA